MVNVAIVGCNGKMGYFVAEAVKNNPETQTLFGVDAYGENKHDFTVYPSFDGVKEKPDVIIDFSNPAALDGMLDFAVKNGVPCVICTTGYSPEQVTRIRKAAESVAVFYSGNMSLGINLLSCPSRRRRCWAMSLTSRSLRSTITSRWTPRAAPR